MSISAQSLGLQQVASPGTPQPIAAATTNTKKWVITPIKALPSTANVGNIYIGTATMNRGTGAGVYFILTPTSLPLQMDRPASSGEHWDLHTKWYVDADNGTDSFLVGYLGE